MKQMKRLTALVLAALLVLSALPLGAAAQDPLPASIRELVPMELKKENLRPLDSDEIVPMNTAATSGTCGDNLTWSYENTNLTISGNGDMYNYSAENPAPWYDPNRVIAYITIEEGVTSIGSCAFSGSLGLNECHIPASVTHVGKHAFSGITHCNLYFWGDAPEFDEEAFWEFDGRAYHFRPWDEGKLLNYWGKLTWQRGNVVLSVDNKQLYALNEAIDADSLIFRAYVYEYKSFAYSPGKVTVGKYDNSTYGQKTVTITADGFELPYTYYVTDGQNHLDGITVEYDPFLYYNGGMQYVHPVVKSGDNILRPGEHYQVIHENNMEVGEGSFTITGMGIYEAFQKTYRFSILKTDLSDATIFIDDVKFYGIPAEPEVFVSLIRNGSEQMLLEGEDYILTYENDVNVGTATVNVVGIGGYYGTASQTFQIVQGETSVSGMGAYNGSALDGVLTEDYYYSEGILCPGVLTVSLDSQYPHVGYYSLYKIVNEEAVLVTEYETTYGVFSYTKFTYDFTEVYNSDNPDGGETYMLVYNWIDSNYDIFTGVLMLFVPSKVPDAASMVMGQVPEDGDFRREFLVAAGEDGVVENVIWTTSDKSVFTVDKGVVTLVKPGSAVITAQAGDISVSHDGIVAAKELADGTIFSYDPASGSAAVIYDGQMLQAGTDYTLTTHTADGVTEVWAAGTGLFTGYLMRQFDAKSGEALGHTHSFDYACDDTCGTCDFTRETGHQYGVSWMKDQNGHWHGCTVCGDKADYAEHTLNENGECTICGPLFTPGDLNGNFEVNEDDAIYLLQHVLLPDFFPVDQEVDYNHDGQVNEDDAIYLLQHVLLPEFFPL